MLIWFIYKYQSLGDKISVDRKTNYLRKKKKPKTFKMLIKKERTHWCFLLFLDKKPFQRKHQDISMG